MNVDENADMNSGIKRETLLASDGQAIALYHWSVANPQAVILIAHGMGEHAQRYGDFARVLNEQGYAVIANDIRGHGETAQGNYGDMGADGWNRVLADAYELNCWTRSAYPDVPIVLFGHSMGSMMSQQYITRYAASIDGLILSGSPGFKAGFISRVSLWLAKFEAWRKGAAQQSNLLQKILFADSNKKFEAAGATGFEWLSRDKDQVDKYMQDDACGFVLGSGSLVDLFEGSRRSASRAAIEKIPKDLPIYIFSGADDPLHADQRDINRMLQAYYDQALTSITVKWYPSGRHEMLNEINADEVYQDIVSWLRQNIQHN